MLWKMSPETPLKPRLRLQNLVPIQGTSRDQVKILPRKADLRSHLLIRPKVNHVLTDRHDG